MTPLGRCHRAPLAGSARRYHGPTSRALSVLREIGQKRKWLARRRYSCSSPSIISLWVSTMSPGGSHPTGVTQSVSISTSFSWTAMRPGQRGTRYVRVGSDGLGTSRYPCWHNCVYSASVSSSRSSASARSCGPCAKSARRLQPADWIARSSISASRTISAATTKEISTASAPGDARHEHDLFGLRIEPVEALCRLPRPHAERRPAPGPPLVEDPLGLPHSRERLRVAPLDAGDVPFVAGVPRRGQNPEDRHHVHLPSIHSLNRSQGEMPRLDTPGRPHPQPLSGAERGARDGCLPSPRRRGAGGEVFPVCQAWACHPGPGLDGAFGLEARQPLLGVAEPLAIHQIVVLAHPGRRLIVVGHRV